MISKEIFEKIQILRGEIEKKRNKNGFIAISQDLQMFQT